MKHQAQLLWMGTGRWMVAAARSMEIAIEKAIACWNRMGFHP